MTDCSKIPTLTLVEDSKKSMESLNQYWSSTEDTIVDPFGVARKTAKAIDDIFNEAEADAISAAQSASAAEAAASTAGYKGLWPDTGGSALKGETWQTQVGGTPTGEYYTALQNTNIDPVGDNVNWRSVVSNQSLGGVTNYQAASVEDMVDGKPIGWKSGDAVIQPALSQYWVVNGSLFRRISLGSSISDFQALAENVDTFIQVLTGASDYNGSLPSANYYGEITKFTPYGNNNLKVYRTESGYEWELDVKGIVGSGSIKLYISTGATGDGLTIGNPMSFATFQTNVTNGDYNNAGSLYINLLDEFYGQDDAVTDFGAITGTKVYLRSINSRGHSWLTGGRKYTYTRTGSYYKVATGSPILYCFNTSELDGNGCPIVYENVGSVGALSPGTWHQSGGVLYVRPIRTGSGVDASIVAVLRDSNKFQWSQNDDAVISENINWATGNIDCLSFAPQSLAAQAVFVRNIFLGGKFDGFGIEAPTYKIAMLDCITAYAGKDGFNYHAAGLSSLNGAIALEVNCIGYYAGLYKYENGNTTTNSNNGSTAHDGMTVIRLGCQHYECEGPVIADVNGCYSINYDTLSDGVIDSTTGDKAAWLFFKAASPTFELSRTVMVNCHGGRSDIDLLTGQGVELIYDKLDIDEQKLDLFAGNTTSRITK